MGKFRDDIKEGGSDKFLKLKDKESIKGIFMGDPYEFYMSWDGTTKRPILSNEGDDGAKFRFRMCFVTKTDSGYKPVIFENGPTVYNMLRELNQEYDLEKTLVKITRNGLALDTTYTIMPLPEKLTDASFKMINALPTLDLKHEPTGARQNDVHMPTYDDLPF